MYLSAYTSDEMRRFHSREDVYYVVGIYHDKSIVKPPICKCCGEYLYIDFKTGYGQCSHCNRIYPLYKSNTLNLVKEWLSLC